MSIKGKLKFAYFAFNFRVKVWYFTFKFIK